MRPLKQNTYPVCCQRYEVIPWSSVLLDPSSNILSRGNDASILLAVIATGGVFCSVTKNKTMS